MLGLLIVVAKELRPHCQRKKLSVNKLITLVFIFVYKRLR